MDQLDHAERSEVTEASTTKSSSKWIVYVLVAVVIVAVGGYLTNAGIDFPFNQGDSSSEAAPAALRPGTIAPDFTLKDLQGNPVKLSDFRGKVVLLNFWATWCPPCRYEMPFVESVYQEQAAKGFVVLAVSIDDDPAAVPQFVKEFGLTFPVVIDTPDKRVSNLYRLYPIPTSYFIDRDGVIRDVHVGAMDKKTILQKISKLM